MAVLEIGQAEGDTVYQLFRVRDIGELADGGIALAFAGLLRDGSAAGWVSTRPNNRPGGFQRYVALLVRVTPGQQPDTLGEFPGIEGTARAHLSTCSAGMSVPVR